MRKQTLASLLRRSLPAVQFNQHLVHRGDDVFEHACEVLRTGEPKLLSYGIEDEEAWNVGLPCGGEIDVFVEKVE